ncbi:hypothetical protein HL666_09140 [Bradyrhizobium sp. 83002]|uniref:hypothetical protein n=1 Tax=Bradyrhizobium aeschynomenes TaxID=2734909 RepID=UPI0015517DE5|nr:hypothetical protein [Bradyrhizobium aeschynomenes]NPU10925.1 hypothetical protein [Bradyrhizobium aeschynomenes]
MLDIASIRAEIEHARKNVARMRRDLLTLQRAGRSTTVAECDLQVMLNRVDTLIGERKRLNTLELRERLPKRVLGGRSW